jgi:LRR adjacent
MDIKQDKRRARERRFLNRDGEEEDGPPPQRSRNGERSHEHRPTRPLIGPGLRKALTVTTVIVVIAVGLRFAWDQLRSTPVGRALGVANEAAKDLFSSEDILRSGQMITGALIRENFLSADGRGYTHRVSYTDRDSLATWTQSGTFDAMVRTAVDTRDLRDAVQPRWTDPAKVVYVVRLPQPQITQPFWVSEARDLEVRCNAAEAVWRLISINPSACSNDGTYADPHLRWKLEQDIRGTALADRELFEMGRRDVENMVEGMARPFIEPLARKYGFDFSFEFVWYTPSS